MRFPIQMSWPTVLRVLGAAPDSAFAEIDRSAGSLRIKFGIWFDETLPLAQIQSVETSDFPWYGGLGVKLGPGDAVSVIGAQEGVLELKFHTPQRMHVLLPVARGALRISMVDPAAFRQALEQALSQRTS